VMSKDQLKSHLSNADVVVIDVRADHDWASSRWKIQGAVREDPNTIDQWMSKYPKDKAIVLYCAWPHEATSARVAQHMAVSGFRNVEVLKGGWHEWYDNKYPVEKK
jgi:rhodanese-related sulfurtransferase